MADTVAGARLYIGTTLAASLLAEFQADTYTVINGISNIGEFGVAANILKFPLISDDFVPKSKGTQDAGDPAIVVARISGDAGQIAMRAAGATKFFYNFKLIIPDAVSELYTDTAIYWRALVAGFPMQLGGVEDFMTETYNLGIYPAPLFDESALITAP